MKLMKQFSLDSANHIVEKILSKLSFAVVVAAVLVIALGVVILMNISSGRDITKCKNITNESKRTLANATKPEDFTNTYRKLTSARKACEDKKLLDSKASSLDAKLDQIQYYHDKATLAYRLGKYEEAKKDAQEGLAIVEGLKDIDKQRKNLKNIVQALEYVRDGTF